MFIVFLGVFVKMKWDDKMILSFGKLVNSFRFLYFFLLNLRFGYWIKGV